MAVISPTYNVFLDSLVIATWANMHTGDTAEPHFVHGKPALVAVQAEGTFNGGTAVGIQGSITGINFTDASTATHGTLSMTGNTVSGVLEAYPYWKPTINSGTADNVTVSLSYWIR
jgi:hypothetical protein